MKLKRLIAVAGVGLVASAVTFGYIVGRARAAGAPAAAPVMTYSGTLTDGTGAPLSGTRLLQFQMWDSAAGGAAPVCGTASAPQALIGGTFHVALPAACVAAAHANSELWTEILLDGTSLGRTKIGAVPYALESGVASAAAGSLAVTIASLQATNVPPGAVLAFDLDACPAGWSPFAPAGGRVVIGANAAGGNGLSARALGQTFGEEAHTLTAAEMPAHSHAGTTGGGNPMPYRVVFTTLGPGSANNHSVGWSPGTSFADNNDAQYALAAHTHDFVTNAAGGGLAHNNLPPSVALLYCRKS